MRISDTNNTSEVKKGVGKKWERMKMSKTDYIDNVRVYNDVTGTLAYFDDWAIANGYEKRMDMRTIMFENGSSEEEIDEEEEGLWNLFFDWCEKHNLTAMDE